MNQSVGAGGEGGSGSAANTIIRAIRQTNVSRNEHAAHVGACRIKGHCLDLVACSVLGRAFGKMNAKLPTLEPTQGGAQPSALKHQPGRIRPTPVSARTNRVLLTLCSGAFMPHFGRLGRAGSGILHFFTSFRVRLQLTRVSRPKRLANAS